MHRSLFLGIEEVGKAHDLFLNGQRHHILFRNRQVLGDDVVNCQADADMPLADQGMPGEPFSLKDLPADDAVTDVRLRAMAAEPGGGSAADADVMEQCGLLDELPVDVPPPKRVGNPEGLGGHEPAVVEDDIKRTLIGEVFFQQFDSFHRFTFHCFAGTINRIQNSESRIL